MAEKHGKPSLLIVGCGDIGGGVAQSLLDEGWRISALRRDIAKLPAGVQGIAVDFSVADSIASLPPLEADYVLFTLTPSGHSAQGYRQVFETALAALLEKLASPQALLFVSSTGVYQQSNHEWVDERSETAPERFSGQSILHAEALIAQAAAQFTCPFSVVRFGGIYGPGRMQMINKVRAGECAPATPLHYTNRIHRDDCVGFLIHLLHKLEQDESLESCYLAVDSEPAPIHEVQAYLASLLGVPYLTNGEPIARTGSKRCANARLLASGYQLHHPDYRSGFRQILESAD